jgi:hypothetical protein
MLMKEPKYIQINLRGNDLPVQRIVCVLRNDPEGRHTLDTQGLQHQLPYF